MKDVVTYTAFEETKMVAHGDLATVVTRLKKRMGKAGTSPALIFSDATGGPIDFNFQGSEKDVQKRLAVFVSESPTKETSGPGRPRLGVVSREISLFPAHWEWLQTQPGGASATLRRLVEDAKKKNVGPTTVKQAQERVHKFMSSVGGDWRGYEEALRALYRKNKADFFAAIESWAPDIKAYLTKLTETAF